jgi:hypothetical protein
LKKFNPEAVDKLRALGSGSSANDRQTPRPGEMYGIFDPFFQKSALMSHL